MTPNEARGSTANAVLAAPEIEAVPLDSLDFLTFVEFACEQGGPRPGTDER